MYALVPIHHSLFLSFSLSLSLSLSLDAYIPRPPHLSPPVCSAHDYLSSHLHHLTDFLTCPTPSSPPSLTSLPSTYPMSPLPTLSPFLHLFPSPYLPSFLHLYILSLSSFLPFLSHLRNCEHIPTDHLPMLIHGCLTLVVVVLLLLLLLLLLLFLLLYSLRHTFNTHMLSCILHT